jgi:hypothetical protein
LARFRFADSFCCGNEEANVGTIVIIMGGHQTIIDGVFTYRVNDAVELVALRAYWELARASQTARKV